MARRLHRRAFLKASSGAGLLAAAALTRSRTSRAAPAQTCFVHGVASGDPLPTAVILWTRVTPPEGAAPPAVPVRWQVSRDPRFRSVVAAGEALAVPEADYTVKVDATGLSPATHYFYRFRALGVSSPVGRTRTAPTGAPEALRFGVVSCSNYEAGFFAAYHHLAQRQDLDFILHLGDYLYEYGRGGSGSRFLEERQYPDPAEDVRGQETLTLAQYRLRHALYKQDPHLQALHARHPFIVTWDDHEVADDCWKEGAVNHQPGEGDFLARRRAAYQAYFEWMPLRLPDPLGAPTRIYRHFRFGDLADLHLLDLRQYRDAQRPAHFADMFLGTDPAMDDPARTLTGRAQLDWLKAGLQAGGARWRLLGSSVMLTPVSVPQLPEDLGRALAAATGLVPRDGVGFNPDAWDGYTADRNALLSHLHAHGIPNVVSLVGDIHTTWVAEVPLDPGTYPASPPVAVELVGTSVTSINLDELTGSPPRTTSLTVEAALRASNRHLQHVELDSHGYSVVEVTPERLQMEWWYLADVTDPGSRQTLGTAWRVEAGTQRVHPAEEPLPVAPFDPALEPPALPEE